MAKRKATPSALAGEVAYPPIALNYDDPDDEQTVFDGVKRVNEFMEARVRDAPGQWFWSHRRWPKSAWVEAGVM